MDLTERRLPPAIGAAPPKTLIVAQRERIHDLEARLGQDNDVALAARSLADVALGFV
jgi:hypothetical protein